MARHKRRGLGGLGSAAGSKAVESVRRNVLRYRAAFRDAQLYASTDPVKALAAIAAAKKALVDAEAGILGARMNRVMVPPEFVAAFKAAAATLSDLDGLWRTAQSVASDLLQRDPEWDNPKYGRAMPEGPPMPEQWRGWVDGLNGLAGRGRRRCCRRGRR